MFFAIDLLLPQHKGRFSLAWIAATRGIRFIREKDIREHDIEVLCDDILKMVISTSTRPKLRFSLSLSSRLINGTVKIYRKQVQLCLDDIITFMQQRPNLSIRQLSYELEPTPEPIIKKKAKKKKVVLDIPVSLEDQEEFIPVLGAQADMVTMREPDITVQVRADQQLQDDIWSIGVLADGETGPPPGPEADEPNVIPLTVSEQQRDIPDIHVMTPSKRKHSDELVETPTKRKAVQREMFKSVPATVPPEELIESLLDEVVPEVVQPEPIQPTSEAEPITTPSTGDQPEPIARLPRERAPLDKDLLKIKQSRVRRINRAEPRSLIDTDIIDRPEVIFITKPKPFDNMSMLSLLMDEGQNLNAFLETMPMRTLTLLSKSSLRFSALSSLRPTTSTPVVLEPPPLTTPHEEIISKLIQTEITEILPPIVEEQVLPPEPERVSIQPDKTIHIPVAIAGRVQKKEKIVIVPKHHKEIPVKERLKIIRENVKNWDAEYQGELTIEDVCSRPINRFNIATAFNDLLSLSKMGYVKLNNKPDSLELGTIEKGSKLLRQ